MLSGKKILLITPFFFSYELEIAASLQKLGAYVDLYNERSINKKYQLHILKLFPRAFLIKSHIYYRSIIKKNIHKNYDYILIIKGEMIPKSIIFKLKEKYVNAKVCLYLWDSISNIKGIETKISLFDYVSTFDYRDSIDYKVNFRPLFYSDTFHSTKYEESDLIFDICFIGTVHSNRYNIIKKIEKIALSNNLRVYNYLYVPSKIVFFYYKILIRIPKSARLGEFNFKKLSLKDVSDKINKSKIIVDVEHPNQHGLTIRTIEIMAMGKKLLTTNKSIVNYDFYSASNIQVIDKDNITINMDFIRGDYCPISDSVLEYYNIKSWIVDILGIRKGGHNE